MADAGDLNSPAFGHVGSTPTSGTREINMAYNEKEVNNDRRDQEDLDPQQEAR